MISKEVAIKNENVVVSILHRFICEILLLHVLFFKELL